jgi:uncharacterized protein (TIGR03086 family)
MTEQEVFVLADRALQRVVAQIRDDQWELVVPDEMTPRQPGWTLRQVVNYLAYDEAWVPDVLAGSTIDEVGTAHDGDLLGADPQGSFARLADAARRAVERLADLDQQVHLSYGDWPAREYLAHVTFFRARRVCDIARFIDADPALPPALVQGLLDELEPRAEQWRRYGVIGAPLAPPADATPQERWLALTGHEPRP